MTVPELSGVPLAQLVSLAGRRAVVTGAAKGIGRAVAHRLAEAGASVLLGDLDEPEAQAAAAEIGGRHGVRALARRLDVAEPASVVGLAETAVAELGGIDIWVNNAGIYPSTPLVDLTDEAWDRVLDVNLRGTFLGCREAGRHMIGAARGGVIVNLSSIAGIRGRQAGVTSYVASKHGIIGITRQVALELAPHAVRVLAVAPTTVVTPGVEQGLTGEVDLEQALLTPLGRAGRPDDVARVVLFCASDLAAFMTGSTLLVDAGEMAV